MASPIRLAVTLGDPRGVGPEVAAHALRSVAEDEPDLDFVVVGPAEHLPANVEHFEISGALPGEFAGRAILAAVQMATRGEVHGLVTAPIHKPALHEAGYDFPGHTEMLRELSGAEEVGMLMVAEETRIGGALRVLLATTHLALRDVPTALTADLLVSQTRLLDRALREQWGIAEPAIALCAFNPHASDDGLFGDEEARIYVPAMGRLRTDGVSAHGPIPADTVFTRALAGEFDAVVVPYHDVGMAAFKTASFGSGVNVTLGLPFVRTSPDHGTAFDVAHTGRADPSSMTHAVRLAARLARARFDSPATPE